jgi:hypothetical protein
VLLAVHWVTFFVVRASLRQCQNGGQDQYGKQSTPKGDDIAVGVNQCAKNAGHAKQKGREVDAQNVALQGRVRVGSVGVFSRVFSEGIQ